MISNTFKVPPARKDKPSRLYVSAEILQLVRIIAKQTNKNMIELADEILSDALKEKYKQYFQNGN